VTTTELQAPALDAGRCVDKAQTRPRALLVTPVNPYLLDSGAAQRSHHILMGLQADFQVDVLILRESDETQVERMQPPTAGLQLVLALTPARPWPWRRFRPQRRLTAQIEQALGTTLSNYALVLGRYIWPVCQLVLPPAVPVLVDLDDWHFRFAPGTRWSWPLFRARLTKAFAHAMAKRQLQRFDGAFTVLASDAVEVAPVLPVTLLPNIPPPPPAAVTPIPSTGRVLFVGSLWYGPNAQAIDVFLQHVWPQVLAAYPAAQLVLVGAASQPQLQRWAAHPRVSTPGFVDDLAAVYREATVVIAPQLSGGGSSIKVLEAMGHGRPCVVSGLVADAYADRFADGREFLVARTARALGDHVLSALKHPAALQTMVDRARLVVLQDFALEGMRAQVRRASAALMLPSLAAA
jgi:glycosyltransferase involved in cell wall biosynthesis